MKTVIYYNVTTGESFDQNGSLRSSNNPFSASYGERRTFEWHLITSADSNQNVSEWEHWTDWDITPQSAVIAADDNYLAAYPGYLKESVSGNTNAIALTMKDFPESIAPAGNIRIFKPDHSFLIFPYTAVNTLSDGFVLAVELSDIELETGTRIDILESPLVSAVMNTNSSVEQGIFSFDLILNSVRLTEKMEYSDIELLTAKGLELCVSGVDPDTSEQTVILRGQVPFVINNVLTPLDLFK
ncbi:MAG: hypothetical protein E7040_02375 [Lentisphaerae bacterium]|nr:hypothetical protein [Lentisphaerota bacterium]